LPEHPHQQAGIYALACLSRKLDRAVAGGPHGYRLHDSSNPVADRRQQSGQQAPEHISTLRQQPN
jgi:hypothetical protein